MELFSYYLPLFFIIAITECWKHTSVRHCPQQLCMHCLFVSVWQRHKVDITFHVFADKNPKAQYLNWTQIAKLMLHTGFFPTFIKLLHAGDFIRAVHHRSVFSLKSSLCTQQLCCRHLVVPCGHSLRPSWWCPPNAIFRCTYKLKDHLNLPAGKKGEW